MLFIRKHGPHTGLNDFPWLLYVQEVLTMGQVTDRPKIYRKSVLHLLRQMQYRFAVNFGALNI